MLRDNIQNFQRYERSYYHEERYHTYKQYSIQEEAEYDSEIGYLTKNLHDLIEGSYELRDDWIRLFYNAFVNDVRLVKNSMILNEFYDHKDPIFQNVLMSFSNDQENDYQDSSFLINRLQYLKTTRGDRNLVEIRFVQQSKVKALEDSLQSLLAREICLFLLKGSNQFACEELFHHSSMMFEHLKSHSNMLHLLKKKFITTLALVNESSFDVLILNPLKELEIFDNLDLLNVIEKTSNNHIDDLQFKLEGLDMDVINNRLNQNRVIHILYKYLGHFYEHSLWHHVNIFEIILNLVKAFEKLPKTDEWKVEFGLIRKMLAQRFELHRCAYIYQESIVNLLELYFSICELSGVFMQITPIWTLNLFFLLYSSEVKSKIECTVTVLKALITFSKDHGDLLRSLKLFGILNMILFDEQGLEAYDEGEFSVAYKLRMVVMSFISEYKCY